MVNANNVSAGSDAGVNHQISICVCTCRRPELLVGCLKSLATMDLPGGVGVTVSVIDNDQQPSARALVDEMQDDFPLPLYYCHVDRSGIPFARNAAIEKTLELDADYLVFIDDDEWVESNWLTTLHTYSLKKGGEAIVSGHVVQELPDGVSDTVRRFFTKRERDTGTSLSACATNNVLIPIFVMRDLHLRFDESHPHMGGEDTVFFTLAAQKGVPIYKCAEAVVHEVIPATKANMKWLSQRKFRVGIIAAWRKARYGQSRPSILLNAVFMVVTSFFIALLLSVFLQFELRNKFWLRVCKYSGVIVRVFGAKIDDYAVIHGK